MGEKSVKQNVYEMELIKKESVRELDECESNEKGYVIFGAFDFMSLKKAEKEEQRPKLRDILKVPKQKTENKGDALVHSISLFSCCDDVSDFLGEFKENFLSNNLTLVTLARLNGQEILLGEHGQELLEKREEPNKNKRGLDILCEIKTKMYDEIKKSLEKCLEDEGKFKSTKYDLKIFLSLGSYDLVIFLSAEDPNLAGEAILRTRVAYPIMSITTSFYAFKNIKDQSEWDVFKNSHQGKTLKEVHTTMQMRMAVDFFADIKKELRKTLTHCLKLEDKKDEKDKKDNIQIGYALGDEDIIVTIEGLSYFNILSMHNKFEVNEENESLCLLDYDGGWVKDKIKQIFTTFAGFEGKKATELAEKAEGGRINYENDRKRALKVLYDVVNEDIHKREDIPYIARYQIFSILDTCNHLIGVKCHQVTSYVFLELLKNGLEQHKRYLDEKKGKNPEDMTNYNLTDESIIGFAYKLSHALNDVIGTQGINMGRMAELYSSSSYYKLLFAHRNMVKEIYRLLPKKKGNKATDIELFLNIGSESNIQQCLYFRMANSYSEGKRIASMDIPNPVFLDLEKAYCYILHEVAHLQYHNGPVRIKEAIRDTVFVAITMRVLENVKNEKMNFTFERVFTALAKLEYFKEIKESKRLIAYLNQLIDALNKAKEGLEKNPNSMELEILKALLFLMDTNFSVSLHFIYDVFMEARADVLMIQMADKNFELKKYIEFWHNHIEKNYSIDPMDIRISGKRSHDLRLIYRICFVIAYYESNSGETPIDWEETFAGFEKSLDSKILQEYYASIKPLTVPFVAFVKRWLNEVDYNEENREGEKYYEKPLFSRLNERWKGYINNSVDKSPKDFELHEQIEFYINHWFKGLMEDENAIKNRVESLSTK